MRATNYQPHVQSDNLVFNHSVASRGWIYAVRGHTRLSLILLLHPQGLIIETSVSRREGVGDGGLGFAIQPMDPALCKRMAGSHNIESIEAFDINLGHTCFSAYRPDDRRLV